MTLGFPHIWNFEISLHNHLVPDTVMVRRVVWTRIPTLFVQSTPFVQISGIHKMLYAYSLAIMPFIIFIHADKHVIDASFDPATVLFAVFIRSHCWMDMTITFLPLADMLLMHQGVQVNEARFHHLGDWFILWLLVEITSLEYWNITVVFVEKSPYRFCVLHTSLQVLRLGFEMRFAEHELEIWVCLEAKQTISENLPFINGQILFPRLYHVEFIGFIKYAYTWEQVIFLKYLACIPKRSHSLNKWKYIFAIFAGIRINFN